jgi:TPR repeat protein
MGYGDYLLVYQDYLAKALEHSDEKNPKRDTKKSAYYWGKPAELGDLLGQYLYGVHLDGGYGIQRNREEALIWLRSAKENGNKDAAAMLWKIAK